MRSRGCGPLADPTRESAECLICRTRFEPFISFGRQPIANGFLSPAQFASEFFYELKVGRCPSCHMVQLAELVDRSKLFHEEYAFFSGTSKGMATHFEQLAALVMERHLGPEPFVVEIGSNDGIMLRHFARRGMRHLGVEPSANVAAAARAQGVSTTCRFFDARLAGEIAEANGLADVVLGANVMCHISDLHSVIEGVRLLLKPRGTFLFEDPYLGDVVEKTSYDQIYDEHVFYFSLTSLAHVFAMHDMEIIDAEPQPVHGGSMRYTVKRLGAGTPSSSVARLLARETELGLDRDDAFPALRRRIEHSREELVELLSRVRAEGKRVVGYGATSKSTTVTNYCGITSDLVEYISDTTPIKQGKFSPGTHIPVRPYAAFVADPPDLALLFAWNHAEEVLRKEAGYLASGGRFIVYVPRVGTLP